jgi:hypothetical protein
VHLTKEKRFFHNTQKKTGCTMQTRLFPYGNNRLGMSNPQPYFIAVFKKRSLSKACCPVVSWAFSSALLDSAIDSL